jgi:selenide,water dikinase
VSMPSAAEPAKELMYCGGCGAKLPADLLRAVLEEVAGEFPQTVRLELLGDDGVVLEFAPGAGVVQSIDVLRALVDDPWLMGRISVLHALSDIYAMGASPHSALVTLTLPYGGPALQQRDLLQLLSGAALELQAAGALLAGGHTIEGPELSIGFAVNGELTEGEFLSKTGVQSGDHLLLCKALGTGVLFAASMQGLADGRAIAAAEDAMLQSNAAAAAAAARQFPVSAGTDVTGFGLAGHLLEMLAGSALCASLRLADLPLLAGVESCFAGGVQSSLQQGNLASVSAALRGQIDWDSPRAKVLFDPQTCGGLLLAVPADAANVALDALHRAGYEAVADIGQITQAAPGDDAATVLIL